MHVPFRKERKKLAKVAKKLATPVVVVGGVVVAVAVVASELSNKSTPSRPAPARTRTPRLRPGDKVTDGQRTGTALYRDNEQFTGKPPLTPGGWRVRWDDWDKHGSTTVSRWSLDKVEA